jgi:hypothetical protein
MGTTTIFKPTAVQKKALTLLKSGAKHILLFDGSRSGKTTVLVMALIYRALRFAGSRHLICRYRAKDARLSVLRETLLGAIFFSGQLGSHDKVPNRSAPDPAFFFSL